MEAGTVSVAVVNETIKTIDPKYIPSGIGEGADIDVVATPGQMIVVKSVDENGKPTEWEAIDIPEGGAQADAVQADMAQSDSSKPDYIKNRTHWKETKLTNATEIIAETTITGARKNFTGVTLEAGKTYAVTYNGETYIRKAAAYSTAVYIGDVSIIIGTAHSTGEPFCLWYNGEYVVLNRRDNAAATISVTEGTAEEVYHQLDRRYIKDMYGDDFAEILPECQLTPMEDGGGFVVFDPLPTDLQPGETYTINWNGAAYECVALPYEEEGVQMGVMLGNAGALTGEGDSNEPFFMAVLSSEYAAAMGIGLIAYALDGSLAPTLSIMGAGGVVKIPEKYLPNCVVKTVNGISPDENGNVEVVSDSTSELILVDYATEEDVVQLDIPVDSALLTNAREVIFEMFFSLPSSDEATAMGKLTMNLLYSWGQGAAVINQLGCLPTNSSPWASITTLTGRLLFSKTNFSSWQTFHSTGAVSIKNMTVDQTYSRSGTSQMPNTITGFRISGSIPIGAGSIIKIYVRK